MCEPFFQASIRNDGFLLFPAPATTPCVNLVQAEPLLQHLALCSCISLCNMEHARYTPYVSLQCWIFTHNLVGRSLEVCSRLYLLTGNSHLGNTVGSVLWPPKLSHSPSLREMCVVVMFELQTLSCHLSGGSYTTFSNHGLTPELTIGWITIYSGLNIINFWKGIIKICNNWYRTEGSIYAETVGVDRQRASSRYATHAICCGFSGSLGNPLAGEEPSDGACGHCHLHWQRHLPWGPEVFHSGDCYSCTVDRGTHSPGTVFISGMVEFKILTLKPY